MIPGHYLNESQQAVKALEEGVKTLEEAWQKFKKTFRDEANESIDLCCDSANGAIEYIIDKYADSIWAVTPKSQVKYECYIREQVGKTASRIVKELEGSVTLNNALIMMRQCCEEKYSEIKQLVEKLPGIVMPEKPVFPNDMADLFKTQPTLDPRDFCEGEEIPGWGQFDSADEATEQIICMMKEFLRDWLLKEPDKYNGPLNILENTVDNYKKILQDMVSHLYT